MKDKSQVKANPRPAFYAVLLESFRKIALEHGYALAIHGSMASDMDIIAIPWVEKVEEPQKLADAIWSEICTTIWVEDKNTAFAPYKQPHGRITYTIPIIGDWYIDFCIMQPIYTNDETK